MSMITADLHQLTKAITTARETGERLSPVRHARLQASILHTAYLATHATGTALRREHQAATAAELVATLRTARDQVTDAELILDAHRHQPARSLPLERLSLALADWTVTAQRTLQHHPPEPKNDYIISDLHAGLLAHTAYLVDADPAIIGDREARARILPALRDSARHWQTIRNQCSRLAAPTTGISRSLADAAANLQRALRAPDLPSAPGATHAISAALAASVVTARSLQSHLRSHELRVPTQTVVALTREVLDRKPIEDAYRIWRELPRLTGRAPIPLPEPLREELGRLGAANTVAAQQLRSAAHTLLLTETRQAGRSYRSPTPRSREPTIYRRTPATGVRP